jgi:tRNA-guanine family transglycosylase
VTRWPLFPKSLILDSGGFQNRKGASQILPQAILARQLAMAEGYPGRAGLCHFDVSLSGTRQLPELERRLAQNLTHAQWLMDHLQVHPLPANRYPIGVIQGYSVETVYHSALILAEMGFEHFALGSLASLASSARDQLLRRVEAALEAVGPALHILGVSSVTILAELVSLGIRSADSSAPMHEAWRGGLFYSRPFRRYKIPSPHFKEWQRSYSFAELLSAPLPCDCPVCQDELGPLLFQPLGRQAIHGRGIHNCYHLLQEVDAAHRLGPDHSP